LERQAFIARATLVWYRYHNHSLIFGPEAWHGSHHHFASRRWNSKPTRLRCLPLKTTFPPFQKETNMQYKTIVLQYLRQRPKLHGQLKSSRTLLPTLDAYANQLKSSHEALKEQLAQAYPQSDRRQIASQALEIALKDWTNSLPPDESSSDDGPLSLDGAMAHIRRHTPPA
jgi:hypothetical protein